MVRKGVQEDFLQSAKFFGGDWAKVSLCLIGLRVVVYGAGLDGGWWSG